MPPMNQTPLNTLRLRNPPNHLRNTPPQTNCLPPLALSQDTAKSIYSPLNIELSRRIQLAARQLHKRLGTQIYIPKDQPIFPRRGKSTAQGDYVPILSPQGGQVSITVTVTFLPTPPFACPPPLFVRRICALQAGPGDWLSW